MERRGFFRKRWRWVAAAGGLLLLVMLLLTYRELGRRPLLALELLSMRRDGRRAREAVIDADLPAAGERLSDKHLALVEEQRRVDGRNTARLKEIVEDHGWPGRSLVGRRGSHAAWLIAQHADHDPDFQRRALRLMRSSGGDVDPEDIAFLTDRSLARDDKKQVHGTQFTCRGGRRELVTPLAAPDRVDDLRRRAGLISFAENIDRLEDLYGPCSKG